MGVWFPRSTHRGRFGVPGNLAQALGDFLRCVTGRMQEADPRHNSAV